MTDAYLIGRAWYGLQLLTDGTIFMYIRIQVAVFLSVDFKLSRMIQINPRERSLIQAWDGLPRLTVHALPVRVDLFLLRIQVHPRQGERAAFTTVVLAPFRIFEVSVDDQIRINGLRYVFSLMLRL